MQAITYSTYPIFEADQVLTSKHLNDVVNYLEEQERLTRNRLIGIGIACGLEVSLSDDHTTVSISPGVGITSDGHLVAFHGNAFGEAANYSFFRPFTFGEREPYDFFKKAGKQIDLFDLHEQKVEEAEPFTEIEGGIEDYVVFLFLDCLDKKLKNCVENDCNEKGTERSFTLRPLLVKRDDARDIICREEELNVPKTEAEIDLHVNARFRLPALEIPRFRLGGNRLGHFNELYVRYDNLIENYMPVLQQSLQSAYERFRPILKNSFGNANPFQNNGNTDLQGKYLTIKNKNPFAVQYFYDMLRDLTDTYNEFRETVFDLMSECCPAPGRFPKHLRLGHLGSPITCEPSPYRTRFTYAPILNDQGVLKQQVLSLFRKMTLLASKFIVPTVEQIKITPSREMHEALSQRAIPYYYNILNEGVLLKNWDAVHQRKCRYNENLSYHSNRYAGTIPHVLNPLQYDHDQYGFLRIEGHLGMNYRTALTNILNTRNQENLPFDVVVLSLSDNASGTTIDFSECHFRDLEIMCMAWRKELECMLGEVVKGISQVDVNQTMKRATLGLRDTTTPFSASLFRIENSAVFRSSAVSGAKTEINVSENVKEKIEVKENSIGIVLNEAVKTATVGGGDYYVHAESLLLKDEDIRQLNRNEYEVAFAAPLLVASRAVAFAENVTGTCDELDIEKLETRMNELVAAAIRYQTLLTNYKATDATKVNVNVLQMIRLMSILIGRCTLEQLKIIKAEIDRRKEQLRKMNLFAEYVSKNPGIDHNGGVPKGGTFLLVYHDISSQDTPIHKGPFDLRGRVVNEKNQPLVGATVLVKGTNKGTTSDFGGFFSIRVDQLPVTLVANLFGLQTFEIEVTDPKQSILLRPGSGSDDNNEIFPVPQRFSVIADFYLPYQCCSDCPPIDYVILPPEGKEALELTPKSYCMPVDPNFPGALFSVYPAKGIVTGPGVSGDVASGFVFKPNEIDMGANDELEVNGFKVNGEDVTLSVMLFKKPEAKFAALVEPVDATGDGLFGQLILDNQSSDNAIKFIWEIQRVLIDGKPIENHIIETDSRDQIVLDTFIKRGEDFMVRLAAFSKNCENKIEQKVDVQIPPREVTLSLFDPNGNPTSTTINRSTADGAFTILATPGQGELGPKDVLKKFKIELAAVTKESNKYVFKVIGGNGTFKLEYVLPEGISNTMSITFTDGGNGGGGSTGPIIINRPGGLGPILINRPRDVASSSSLELFSNHNAILTSMRNDPRFRSVLGPTSDSFKVTSNVTEDLLTRIADGSLAAELVAGKFNGGFSSKMSVALKDTTKRLAAARNAKDQDFILQLLKLQLEQITTLAAVQTKDLSARDPLSKLVTEAIAEVKKLQERGVKMDKGKALSKSLSAIIKDMGDKPKAKERMGSLIAQIKKG